MFFAGNIERLSNLAICW